MKLHKILSPLIFFSATLALTAFIPNLAAQASTRDQPSPAEVVSIASASPAVKGLVTLTVLIFAVISLATFYQHQDRI